MKNSMKKCFIDFDGTIVNNKKRLYQFFVDNLKNEHKECLDINEYWQMKKLAINEVEWVNKTFSASYSVSEIGCKKARDIENDFYLSYEEIFDYSIDEIKRFKKQYFVVLVTRRENEKGLQDELNRFKLADLFDDVIILKHGDEKKSDAIKKKYNVTDSDILIGDTEDDLYSGYELGCKTYFVLSGIRGTWLKTKIGFPVTMVKDLTEVM